MNSAFPRSTPRAVNGVGADEEDHEELHAMRTSSPARPRESHLNANDDDDERGGSHRRGARLVRPRDEEPPRYQTPQFWTGALLGFLFNVLAVPIAVWAWAAADEARKEDRPVKMIAERRALFCGVLFGCGISTSVVGVVMAFYILAGTNWPVYWALLPVVAVLVGPVVTYRGLAGWIRLQEKYRMRQCDLIVLTIASGLAVGAVIVFMIYKFVDALSKSM